MGSYVTSVRKKVIKKNGTLEDFDINKVVNAANKSATRVMYKLSPEDTDKLCNFITDRVIELDEDTVTIEQMHNIAEKALSLINEEVADSYRSFRNYKQDFVAMLDKVYKEVQRIMYIGDKENSNTDSALVSSKRSLIYNQLNKELYKKFFLTVEELQACKDGYIYIHDMSARRDTMNCCIADIPTIMHGGFEMGNLNYCEPKTLDVAFDVIGDIVLSAASQQYGGFTIPEIDKLLVPYAEREYRRLSKKYRDMGVKPARARKEAVSDVVRIIEQGFQGFEMKFNSVASSRGDYPFIAMTTGLDTSKFGKIINKKILKVRKEGQGKPGHKRIVLFPKIIMLYDEELHGEGKIAEDVFDAGIDCNAKAMYPDWLSLTGDGYVASMYKKYKKVVSPMGCVDGQELIVYRLNGEIVFDSFENFWNLIATMVKPKVQIEGQEHLYIDLADNKNGEVELEIYDTVKGFVKVKKLVRNLSTDWRRVKLTNGRRLMCTADHPFETENRGVVHAKDLKETDVIRVNQKTEISGEYTNSDKCLDICGREMKVDTRDLMLTKKCKLRLIASTLNAYGKTNNTGEVISLAIEDKQLSYKYMYLIQSVGYPCKRYKVNGKYVVEFKCDDELFKMITNSEIVDNYRMKDIKVNEASNVIDVVTIEKEDYSYDVETESGHFEVSGIYSHNCRAFLSPWYERGGMEPADENDEPVFVGRFNIGVVSLNLPMIYMKAQQENKDFYEELDYYLEMIREIHIRTYDYLGEMKASTNPLMYCEGGFYGGHLKPSDKIKPILKPMTASFGITALNELQELYNKKSIREDGQFALEVMEYINKRVDEFKHEDGNLYAIYGTPAEGLCGKQVTQFRQKYGIIENVSDREYVSNSFHCHVSEDMSPIEKQDKETRFWNLFNGGKIQYVKYHTQYNKEAMKVLIRRAMKLGLYEGANLSLSFCDKCGYSGLKFCKCPKCGGQDITMIEKMNGYLSYSRVHGDTRLNSAKMAEIKDRVSM